MTVFTSVILLSLVLVDDYLISLALLEDLSLNCVSLYEWCAYDKLVSAYSYYFVKYYCIAYVCNELFYSELVSLLYSVLLATCLLNSSPCCTLYCLPPVLMIAYIISNSSLNQTRRSLGATLKKPAPRG